MPKKILIVEDNKLNMKLLKDILEAHNYQIIMIYDGIGVIELAKKHKPDLILLDVHLPGVCGLEIAQSLKISSELKTIPVIAVTAYAMKGDEEKVLSKGYDAYISKPISVDTLLNKISSYI